MLQRERRAKLTHDMYFACGIVGASALLLPIRRRIEKKREKNHHDYDGATHSLVFVGSLLLTSSSWIATEKLNQGMFAYLPRACAAEIPYQNHYSWIKQAACFHRTSLQVRRGKRLDVRTGDTGPVGRRHFISELASCLSLLAISYRNWHYAFPFQEVPLGISCSAPSLPSSRKKPMAVKNLLQNQQSFRLPTWGEFKFGLMLLGHLASCFTH